MSGNGAEGGEGGIAGEAPESVAASRALCEAADSYASRCDTLVYSRHCGETFQYLPLMDLVVKQGFVDCFGAPCDETSLSKCYAEAIAAAEPDWIDPDDLPACVTATDHCSAAVRGELAACLATAEACDWPIGVSNCWHLATLADPRRSQGMACATDDCVAWQHCTSDALHQ